MAAPMLGLAVLRAGGDRFRRAVDSLEYAFQPIVNVHSGTCFGFEALLRNVVGAGWPSLDAFFADAHAAGRLADVELMLQEKAIATFRRARPPVRGLRLFCNLDSRSLESGRDLPAETARLAREAGMADGTLAIEISEASVAAQADALRRRTAEFERHGVAVAIDDFGMGYGGLQLVYDANPRFLKIDGYFIRRLADDPRRRAFVQGVVSIAHRIGVSVIAEGVETEAEYLICRQLGFDLIQGHLVAPPSTDIDGLCEFYDIVSRLAEAERREGNHDGGELAQKLTLLPTLAANADMTAAVEAFRRHGDLSFLPVVDALDQPIGIVRERRLKALLYTQYGWHLLNNSHYRRQVRELVEPCPIVDARRAVEDVVASYAADAGDEGLLVVRDMTYVGFLTSRSLLGLVAEQELAAARDQNPLTKLPGNTRIYAYVSRALADGGAAYTLCYFDFDNFKPFNDSFGFRQGDRAIILFADLMRGMLPPDGSFIGHVGGDDFFAGFHGGAVDQAADLVRRVTTKFATDVQSFYDATSRALGHIEGKDRDGRPRRFPLMTVSAVLVPLPPGRQGGNLDEIAEAIAIGKKLAKHDPARVATVDLKLQTH